MNLEKKFDEIHKAFIEDKFIATDLIKDQCVQIAKDYAEAQKEQEAIEFGCFIALKGFNKYTQKSYCGKTLMWFTDKKGLGVTTEELYQLFKNRENER